MTKPGPRVARIRVRRSALVGALSSLLFVTECSGAPVGALATTDGGAAACAAEPDRAADAEPSCARAGACCAREADCCYGPCVGHRCACSSRGALCATSEDCCPGQGDCLDGFCGWTEQASARRRAETPAADSQ